MEQAESDKCSFQTKTVVIKTVSAAEDFLSRLFFSGKQVPVQRVTKYPLLLSRLYKVTPHRHEDRNTIKLSQERIEAALEQMNKVRV